MKFIMRWLLNGLALLLVAWLLDGITLEPIEAALIAGLVLGLVNALIRPVLKLLALPLNLMTFGLVGLIINGGLFWFVSELVAGFEVAGFGWALLGAILVAIISALLGWILGVKK